MGYLSWILGALGAIMLGLVKDEIAAWLPRLARWCVLRAADQMSDRERWREEWLAHLDECPGKLGQLSHALGVLGVGQLRRVRFWLEVLYYLRGIRWMIIDTLVNAIGVFTSGCFVYMWYIASESAYLFATFPAILIVFSFYSHWNAKRLIPIDRALLKAALEYKQKNTF